MDDLNYVVTRLMADGKDKWEAIAEATGVPVHTIIKVARRQTENPRFHTISPLIKYYRGLEAGA